MLESIDWATLITGGTGAGAGAATTGWVIKTLITRALKANDEKHKASTQGLEKLATSLETINGKVGEILTDIAVIKSRMGEVMNVRDDVVRHEKDLAIALERIADNKDDLNRGFASVRASLKNAS